MNPLNKKNMCVNKLKIRNNKLDFNPIVDRLFNYVPCGRCEECLRSKITQYETRLICEYDATKKIGGSTFYYTLTYDEQHCPKLFNKTCFSKADVQKFFKRLRKSLNCKFKYFLSSEYGHKTFRPHYHVIFFFDRFLNSKDVYDEINSNWQLGNVFAGLNLGLVVNSIPFRYVAKYVDKDISSVRDLVNKGYSESEIKMYKEEKETQYKNFDILPFHLQSNNLGLSYVNFITDDDITRGYYVASDALGVSRKVAIPLYFLRHLIFEQYINLHGNVSYRLNQRGKKLYPLMLKNQINNVKNNFDTLLGMFSRYSDIPLVKKLHVDMSLLQNSIRQQNYTQILAQYVVLYRGRKNIPFGYKSLDDDISIFCNTLINGIDKPFDDVSFDDVIDDTLDELLFKIFECVKERVDYEEYVKKVNSYNVNQQFRSFRTKKDKYKLVKTFREFKNLSHTNSIISNLLKR